MYPDMRGVERSLYRMADALEKLVKNSEAKPAPNTEVDIETLETHSLDPLDRKITRTIDGVSETYPIRTVLEILEHQLDRRDDDVGRLRDEMRKKDAEDTAMRATLVEERDEYMKQSDTNSREFLKACDDIDVLCAVLKRARSLIVEHHDCSHGPIQLGQPCRVCTQKEGDDTLNAIARVLNNVEHDDTTKENSDAS